VADNRDDDRVLHRRGKRRVVEEVGAVPLEREPDPREVEPAVRLLKENMIITAIGSASQMISSTSRRASARRQGGPAAGARPPAGGASAGKGGATRPFDIR